MAIEVRYQQHVEQRRITPRQQTHLQGRALQILHLECTSIHWTCVWEQLRIRDAAWLRWLHRGKRASYQRRNKVPDDPPELKQDKKFSTDKPEWYNEGNAYSMCCRIGSQQIPPRL